MDNAPRNKTSKRMLGDVGEDIASQWYLEHGYKIVGRNVQVNRVGEIDLVLSRSCENSIEYVFAEVKTRRGSKTGFGYEAVNYSKRLRMRNSAIGWIGENIEFGKFRISWRLDVVSIDLGENPPLISVYEDIEV